VTDRTGGEKKAMDTVKLTIDGMETEVERGTTVLEAARRMGKEIPTLCHDDRLKPFGSCFICVVELQGRPNLVPSCSTEATQGMVVRTESETIAKARTACLELLLSDHLGDCVAPCREGCPGGLDIPGFIKALNEGRDRDAIALIKERLAMPAMLGRVCPRPCEGECRRPLVDDKPVAICELKRFAADRDLLGDDLYVPPRAPATGKRVAIVGAGPAGISAAFYLQQKGHACVVFEAQEKAGGMVRYGIPSYRLPRDVIEREVGVVERLGAEIRYNTRIGADLGFDQLRAGYDAVFVGVGAQKASRMGCEGEDSPGVLSGIGFLAEVSRDETRPIGRRVMVVGGGNTAIDAARTALRLGAEEVRILYRRTRKEMPAWEAEIHEAEVEGVALDILAAPTKIAPRPDGALDVTSIRMELGEPDASGRRRPVPLKGSEFVVTVDNVIAAIGQAVDAGCLAGTELSRTKWATFVVNDKTLETNVPGVFAGGDCVIGPDIAIRAVAAGRLAAVSIDQYLRGEEVVGDGSPIFVRMGKNGEVVPEESYAGARPGERVKMPTIEIASRVACFEEVESGLPDGAARGETARCLECGCRAERDCKLRLYGARYGADPTRFKGDHRLFARDDSHPEITYESHKCIGCGVCVRLCQEVLGVELLGFVGRGFTARIGTPFGKELGAVGHRGVEVLGEACPTGALCVKPRA
jgi:formate dehydrogenase major subunit